MESNDLIPVGIFRDEFNRIVQTSLPVCTIYRSRGLVKHLIKRNHTDCIQYIDYIPLIIRDPDYIGVSPRQNQDIELVKRFDKNVLIGIKLDKGNEYLFVATMYILQDAKLERRLFSGRLKRLKP